jgi:hypothetical protein
MFDQLTRIIDFIDKVVGLKPVYMIGASFRTNLWVCQAPKNISYIPSGRFVESTELQSSLDLGLGNKGLPEHCQLYVNCNNPKQTQRHLSFACFGMNPWDSTSFKPLPCN